MDDNSPKSGSTQANIDELVKELSRPQSAPANPQVSPAPAPKPVMPPSSGPVLPPKPAAPSAPTTAPKPPLTPPAVPAKPAVPAPAPKEYQSSIRTMSDDLAKLKSGQQPQGVNVPRKIEEQKPVTPAVPPKPAVPAPVAPKMPSVQTNLGQNQKTVPLTPPIMPKPAAPSMPGPATPAPKKPTAPLPPTAPVKPADKSQFYTPEMPASTAVSGSRTFIFIGIAVAAVVLAVAYWYFMIRQPSAPEVAVQTPVVTITPLPTATPVTDVLKAAFPQQSGTIVLPSSGDPAKAFNTALSTQTVSPASFGVVSIANSVASTSQNLTSLGLMDRFLIAYPTTLKGLAGDSRILAYGQTENYDSKGQPLQNNSVRLVLVTQVASSSAAAILQSWEPNMTASLAGLLNFDKTKDPKNAKFTDNTYQGVSVRFKNYPYPDHSIDYGFVTVNGKTYWILASSRESMFAAVRALSRIH